jgi:polyhydroxybutyrate depolymerase
MGTRRTAAGLALVGAIVSVARGAAGDSASDLAARPYRLYVPRSLDATAPAPLLIGLFGTGESMEDGERDWRLVTLAEAHGLLYVAPRPTQIKTGSWVWNGTVPCCASQKVDSDDVTYIDEVIDDVASHHRVDAARIWVFGYSGGAQMAHRLACERAGRIAGIVSFAGTSFLDPARCAPSRPVAVLEVHGDRDLNVPYLPTATVLGARATVDRWAGLDGCAGPAATTGTLNLTWALPGAETEITSYPSCPVELWTVHGGDHGFAGLHLTYRDRIFQFLSTHSR